MSILRRTVTIQEIDTDVEITLHLYNSITEFVSISRGVLLLLHKQRLNECFGLCGICLHQGSMRRGCATRQLYGCRALTAAGESCGHTTYYNGAEMQFGFIIIEFYIYKCKFFLYFRNSRSCGSEGRFVDLDTRTGANTHRKGQMAPNRNSETTLLYQNFTFIKANFFLF